MINDMLDLGNGRLINCYNQGAIAIWDLSQPLSNDIQPLSYQTVHNSFTYKIRRIDDETVLTCSNDLTAKLYDL
jgi:WD40 repeat protein